MYERREVPLKNLLPGSGEPSMAALRERATAGILEYLGSHGPTQLYDEILSLLRCRAARACKKPGVTWTSIEASVRSRSQSINETAIRMLHANSPEETVIEAIADLIRLRL